MANYLLIWDLNSQYISEDPVTRGNQWKELMKLVEVDYQKGFMKDWGAFIAEQSGYYVEEGSELEVVILAQQYTPYVVFETHNYASLEQTKELLNALTRG